MNAAQHKYYIESRPCNYFNEYNSDVACRLGR